jgi:hypothetical protein
MSDKCDAATGVFTHSRDTVRTPCVAERREFTVQMSGHDVAMVVCAAHDAPFTAKAGHE